ncbi:hypothetical protein [Halomicrobium katesii]|uniref:hypothetical protein n=1 Tax=Halomicrobium katesii TaxID=437163 RepID=UPI00037DA5BC|nr:hypothetical protein [Halomicrobium katesii]
MNDTKSGDGWTVEVTDGTMIWEFLPGMELSVFGDEAFETFEELLARDDITGMMTVVKLDDPFTPEVFDIWERSAEYADNAGIDRWAVVADGIKAISLRGKIDTGDLETLTTENRTEAVEWTSDE